MDCVGVVIFEVFCLYVVYFVYIVYFGKNSVIEEYCLDLESVFNC